MAQRSFTTRAGGKLYRFIVPDPPVVPGTPTGLAATDAGNERDVSLTWVAADGYATSYTIEHEYQDIDDSWHAISGSPFVVVAPASSYTLPAWQGNHRFRISANNAVGSSSSSSYVTQAVAGDFTDFSALKDVDTVIVYVADDGNDSNDGLTRSTPKLTLDAGYALLRDQHPDWLALKCGSEFDGQNLGYNPGNPAERNWIKRGLSTAHPMCVTCYGDRSLGQPSVRPTSIPALLARRETTALQYVVFEGFCWRSEDRANVDYLVFCDGMVADLRFENLAAENIKFGFAFQGYVGTITRVDLFRCMAADCYSVGHAQGIFIGTNDQDEFNAQPEPNQNRVDFMTIDECVMDQNGWSPTAPRAADVYTRNMYLVCWDLEVTNCIDARGSSGGIQQRLGGICHNNLVLEAPLGISFGHAETRKYWPTIDHGGEITDNVILDSHNIDSSPRGIGISIANGIAVVGVEISGNVISMQSSGTGNVAAIYFEAYQGYNPGDDIADVEMFDNYFADWGNSGNAAYIISVADAGGVSHVTGCSFHDNVCIQTQVGAKFLSYPGTLESSGAIDFANNKYGFHASETTPFDGASLATWQATYEATATTITGAAYVDPFRTIATYMASIGESGGVDEFLALARLNHRGNWDKRFTAKAVNAYIRAGWLLA